MDTARDGREHKATGLRERRSMGNICDRRGGSDLYGVVRFVEAACSRELLTPNGGKGVYLKIPLETLPS